MKNSRTSKIACLAFTALAILLAVPLHAGSIKAKFTASRTVSPSSATSTPAKPQIKITIRGRKGDIKKIVIQESGIDYLGGRYTETEVITPGGRSYISRGNYTRVSSSGSVSIGTLISAGTGRVKATKSGKVSAKLRAFPARNSTRDSSGYSEQFSDGDTIRISAKKKLSYLRTLTSSNSYDGEGLYSKTVIRGSRRAKGNVN